MKVSVDMPKGAGILGTTLSRCTEGGHEVPFTRKSLET